MLYALEIVSDDCRITFLQPVVQFSSCVSCLYVHAVTCEDKPSVPLPEGLVLVEEFVSAEEEALLLAAIDWSSANDDVTGEGDAECVVSVCVFP